jgi:hypothetical protein
LGKNPAEMCSELTTALRHFSGVVSYYNTPVEIHPSARNHGVADEDITHAMRNAITTDDQDDDMRLYLGPSRSAQLLEIGTVMRDDGAELVIHAMKTRSTYIPLLPES